MNWTIDDIDRTEEDCMIEKVGDCVIYSISDFDVFGYGVLKNNCYWVKYVFINQLSSTELSRLCDDLLIEARKFCLGLHANQLSLF